MKVAIVHEWLDVFAGSESVVAELLSLFPEADLYTVVDFMPAEERSFLEGRTVKTTFIQRLPFARHHFRNYLPLMPLAIEQFDMTGYDVVISSSHAVAKGVLTGPDQVHISYVHTPIRYAWDLQHQYLDRLGSGGFKRALASVILHRMRSWDVKSAVGVDHFIANSTYIARRIAKYYRRESQVIHPPVATDEFTSAGQRGDEYVTISRHVPYKRVDLIVQAFARMPERKLLVVGEGPEHDHIRSLAQGCSNIRFLAPLPRDVLIATLQQARAFVFAAEEDFGITMVEAQSCGIPVIAYGRGGALDIVLGSSSGSPTGVLFEHQTAESIRDAVGYFESTFSDYASTACRRNAMRFSKEQFRKQISDAVTSAMHRRTGAPLTFSDPPPPARSVVTVGGEAFVVH